MRIHQYWVYITTNPEKTVLYIGVTNNLKRRLSEHFENRGSNKTFAGKYLCYNLVYYEEFKYIDKAISREKQLKKWTRKKKNWLIEMKNPKLTFLNSMFSANELPKKE
jgi:putative endonuclease